MNKQIYMIFYDRGYRAQDNAEHICRWVMKNHPEIKTGYILDSDSFDWYRLKADHFNLIDLQNRYIVHEELKKCDYACSSIFNEKINLNFDGCTCKRIFLNHGCFLAPINYIKNEHNNIDLFIAANKVEYDTLLNPYHMLDKSQVALCGQPRHDDLVRMQKEAHIENAILIQFWQRPGEWHKNNNKKFLDSVFYKKTSELLSNSILLNICRKNHLKIIFKMHPIQYDWLQYYKKFENDIVQLSDLSIPFEQEFIRSKFMITDISSNAYEMAKIGKPCIYFEPDPTTLYNWRAKRNGGYEFDLNKNSIGPIIYSSIDNLIIEICNLIKNKYILDSKYLSRMHEQVSFLNDTNNCKRCFEAILSVKTSKTAEKTKAREANINTPFGQQEGSFLYF